MPHLLYEMDCFLCVFFRSVPCQSERRKTAQKKENSVLEKMPAAPAVSIVLLLADDLGFNMVGYHNSTVLTPRIDALAKGGVRFVWIAINENEN